MGLFRKKPKPGEASIEVHTQTINATAKLAELHKKGVLSDYEFAVAKQKLLGENWDN